MSRPGTGSIDRLLADVRRCRLCTDLPLGPRPLVQLAPGARILVAGQAPGRRTHASGIPFDDASGERLRDWLGVDRDTFYDADRIAILPMGFCYPGRGPGGDLPPRAECAPAWRRKLLRHLPDVQLTVLIGQYAQQWHLDRSGRTVADNVRDWQRHWPDLVPLPHPSPRNAGWLKRNTWVEALLLPALKLRVRELLA